MSAAFDFHQLDVQDVSRNFERRRALSHVSFACAAGEIIGLLGPNGAGKSTLLGILSTLAQPTSGRVVYGDRTAAELGDVLRGRIGVLGHDLFLYPDLTARENLAFFARLHGLRDSGDRVARALSAARLDGRAGDRVAGFSRGLRQRLALERALLHTPRLVLLDEPFTGLDDESTGLLRDRLLDLRKQGAIVLMATHDFESAEGVFDRVICLTNGKVAPLAETGGTLRERYRRATRTAGA